MAFAPWTPPAIELDLPDRGRLTVRDSGAASDDRPTVVLLHGLSVTADLNWFTAYPALVRSHRVLAVDHRGHGHGLATRRFRLADCADDVAAVCARLGVHRAVLVGYSMGGPIAQLTWRRHRSLVDGLVLCATARNFAGRPGEQVGFGLLPGLAVAARLQPRPVRRRLVAAAVERRAGGGEVGEWARDQFRRADPAAVLEAAADLGRFDSSRWIGAVDVPAAVVVTEADRLVPPHRQHRLAAAIPDSTVHRVVADHGAPITAPDRFVPALLAALASVVARRPIAV